VVVDDLAMDVTHVVRGADLLTSTPRQIALARALDPRRADFTYLHVPLVVDAAGERLAKRSNGQMVGELRARGMSAEEVLGELAFGLGVTADRAPRSARALALHLRESSASRTPRFRREPFPTPFAEPFFGR
jgi:glutamyl-tRNA synthetase